MTRRGASDGRALRPPGGVNRVARLAELACAPQEQIGYALDLIATQRQQDIVEAALDVVSGASDGRIHGALVARYAYLAADGTRRDAGCSLRAALLRALRRHALPDDIPLLEQALATYEFMPPTRAEVAADLRAAALVALAVADPALAGYRAVHALYDQFTSRLTGEPAVTAVRTLASQGHELALYAYVIQDTTHDKPPVPKVVAECLRQMTTTPRAVLDPLIARCLEEGNDVTLVGLFDLLLTHQAHDAFNERIMEYLRATRSYDVFRYVVATIVAGRHENLIGELRQLTARETDLRKAEMLRELLGAM